MAETEGKTLILLRGPMGVGKSTLGELLFQRLDGSAYLDGDWCWRMHPFVVDEAGKAMVLCNIIHLLRGYLRHPALRYIIFSWVLQREDTLQEILGGLRDLPFAFHCYKLICTPEALRARLEGDVAAGRRTPDVIERSLRYLPLYDRLQGMPIDVSDRSPEDTVALLLESLGRARSPRGQSPAATTFLGYTDFPVERHRASVRAPGDTAR